MKKVMVAMSGGVDSSAALLILKEKYELIGVTLKLFDNSESDIFDKNQTGENQTNENQTNENQACCSLSDVEDAKIVASRFNIPHYVYNFNDKFKKDVINRFNTAYLEGKTPNPCIDCNKYIKFDALLERAISLDCEYMATGHYARVEYDNDLKRWLLKKAVSGENTNEKDQSYVLYNMTQFQLEHTLFPLGNMKKEEARRLADDNGLVNSKKPDSQDICFVPDGNYAEFIKNNTGIIPESGFITDKNGLPLGTHNGLINYTVGQRRGLGISYEYPLYVIEKDVINNRVVVGSNNDLFKSVLVAGDMNWISIPELNTKTVFKAKTRYRQTEQACEVSPLDNGKVSVEFEKPQRALTSGQSIVFYDGDIVAGGGVIL